MAVPLYDVTIGTYLQQLNATGKFLAKSREHFESNNIDLQTLVEARICDDMLPLSFQVGSVVHHSARAVDALISGTFGVPSAPDDINYGGLEGLISDAIEHLKSIDKETIEQCSGKEIIFSVGDRKLPFTAEGFVLSFSLPNVFFHATTAYDILRGKGAPIGKRDYLGNLKMKES